jgi:uncharacterized protein (DUF1697 family)
VATQIVLLRGINLGSANRISMPDLRDALTAAGYENVRTYLQSGNVVVSSDDPPNKVAARCKGVIAERFGLDIDVVVRTRDELAAVVRQNPLGDAVKDPKRYQVSFLEDEPDGVLADRLAADAAPEERVVIEGREIYAWHPAGVARSKLWAELANRKLGVTATARNWTTVTKLLELADD